MDCMHGPDIGSGYWCVLVVAIGVCFGSDRADMHGTCSTFLCDGVFTWC